MAAQRNAKWHNIANFVAGFVLVVTGQGDAVIQRVFLSSNNPTPCLNATMDFTCYYPDVLKRENEDYKYSTFSPSWRRNGHPIFPNRDVFKLSVINQTASRLRVRIDPATFTGDPASFTCFLLLSGGGEDSASRVVDPLESAAPPAVGSLVLISNIVILQWNHTDKGPCFNDLTFSYNITWYPVVGGTGQMEDAKSTVASNCEDTMWYVITNLLPSTSYQVEIVGFTSTSPRVYSEPVTVGFATDQDNTVEPTSDQDCVKCCNDSALTAMAGFILVAVPVMVVAVCALVVSVLVSVALSVRIHCLKNKVKELVAEPNKEKDVEMETNPAYVSVVPSVPQGGNGGGETKYMNVGPTD